jgi:tetratricopeptide (TPR) repeat protein
MKPYNFDDVNLPKVNANEDLETISNNFFRPLFDVRKFEIRSETLRDKGIDFHIELKKEQSSGDWVYTNFRFAVQLKATESIEANADGSFSIQIYSSNINYLLNNGMPAFYVFYHKPTQVFYYESANTFFVELQKKNILWNKQEKHSLRFSKLLDDLALSAMYQETFDKGILFSQLNQHLKFVVPKARTCGIIIDTDNEIYSVAENIAYIDQFGPELINGQHFNFIIEMEQRTYPRDEGTPRFNLVCGIAYFQRGNLYKAIEFLKLALQKSEVFEQDIQAMLIYTLLNARFLLGILSEEDFGKEIFKITQDPDSGMFFEIEKAYNDISSNKVKPVDGIRTLYRAIPRIIKKD